MKYENFMKLQKNNDIFSIIKPEKYILYKLHLVYKNIIVMLYRVVFSATY